MAGTVEKKVTEYLKRIAANDGTINAFLHVRDEKELLKEARALDKKDERTRGKLWGKIIGVKSNINVKGLPATCASKTLEDYYSSYDATVIERVKKEDGLIIGMTNCDEFASGWTGETSAFGPTENPAVPGHVAGGSSSGSAAAVAAQFCDMTLGSDTGGSIRVPASFCGVVGVKPSYGFVSRYGLIDLSMSLDQIGPLANSVADATLLLDVIRGIDERDTTTFASKKLSLKKPGKLIVGVVRIEGVNSAIQKLVDSQVTALAEKHGWSAGEARVKYIDLAVETYHPLVWTEFYSATRRFDGRKYGKKIEDASGKEVLRRIFGGSEIAHAEHAGQYYHKALQVKERITEAFEKKLDEVDCLIMPTSPVLPPMLNEKLSFDELSAIDKLTIPANLAGICAVSVPIGTIADKPVGLQVICGKGDEARMLSIAREIEGLTENK